MVSLLAESTVLPTCKTVATVVPFVRKPWILTKPPLLVTVPLLKVPENRVALLLLVMFTIPPVMLKQPVPQEVPRVGLIDTVPNIPWVVLIPTSSIVRFTLPPVVRLAL